MLESNLQALEIGFGLSEDVNLSKESGLYTVGDLGKKTDGRQMLITGNEATAGLCGSWWEVFRRLSYYTFNK